MEEDYFTYNYVCDTKTIRPSGLGATRAGQPNFIFTILSQKQNKTIDHLIFEFTFKVPLASRIVAIPLNATNEIKAGLLIKT